MLNFPSIPERHFQAIQQFLLNHVSRFTCLHERNCEIQEDVSELILFEALHDFDKLQCLKSSNRSSCGSESGDNTTCLEFDVDPIHWVQLIVLTTAVCHAVHEVDVEVTVIIFFECFSLYNILIHGLALLKLECFEQFGELFSDFLHLVNGFNFFFLLFFFNDVLLARLINRVLDFLRFLIIRDKRKCFEVIC